MEERTLTEDEMELYGLKLKFNPLEDIETEVKPTEKKSGYTIHMPDDED